MGHSAGTVMLQVVDTKRDKAGTKDRKSFAPSFVPRLMSLEVAAQYLSISYWTVRDLIQAGKIPTRKIHRTTDGETIRRILIDRADLDAFVDRLPRE
jgi:excisionase family DNA binding protein